MNGMSNLSSTGYLVLGYTIAFGLLWGYAAFLWFQRRSLRRASDV